MKIISVSTSKNKKVKEKKKKRIVTYYFLENGAPTKRNHLKINFITGSNNLYFFYIILNKFQRTSYIFETSLNFYFDEMKKKTSFRITKINLYSTESSL